MNVQFTKEDTLFVRNYHWLGIIVVCLLSFPLHFVYEWTGEISLVGIFTPINESIWEHLKLVFWPLLLWWGFGYLIYRNKKNLSFKKWVTAASISVFFSMTFIVSWYYVWVHALNTESSIIDIGSLFIAVPLGQLLAIHLYKVVKSRTLYFAISVLLILLFVGLFAWFTFNAPELPLFVPPS